MEIKVIRDTGFVGRLAPINLLMDGEEIKKLQNNEEYIIKTKKKQVHIKAKQWFFGSQYYVIEQDETIRIKGNPIALLFYFISLILLLIASFAGTGQLMQQVLAFAGFASITVTFILCVKRYFLLKY